MQRFFYWSAVVLMISSCSPAPEPGTGSSTETTETSPTSISYQVVKEYPHDAKAFTQGLVVYKNNLLEGTGQYGESNVRRVDITTGKVLQQTSNTKDIFGEGITILNGKLYQLTWQNNKGYVYDAASLKLEREFPVNTEGWGLTNNGKELILSDGSSNLYFLDPLTLKETHRLGVFDNMGPKANINELEFIHGFVYGNVWQTDYIIKIDPASGKIVGRADLGDLRGKTGIPANGTAEGSPDVLNGIAWDSTSNKIYITGKYWPKLFEVKLDN